MAATEALASTLPPTMDTACRFDRVEGVEGMILRGGHHVQVRVQQQQIASLADPEEDIVVDPTSLDVVGLEGSAPRSRRYPSPCR